ncbi:MAG: hypothetical protein E5X34_13250 [Mesorhizobium sp.]|uniref:hypothetical protein n=1 Tax=Mesorhizobium sp. TaxID=1871066 RepID=UPI0012275B1C|nr:hypothetical protein [Mesorhizobium sp.]TIR24016.1 MAG: hypothetical protein E5X34_13250 [Mesorhizobium sp.]
MVFITLTMHGQNANRVDINVDHIVSFMRWGVNATGTNVVMSVPGNDHPLSYLVLQTPDEIRALIDAAP